MRPLEIILGMTLLLSLGTSVFLWKKMDTAASVAREREKSLLEIKQQLEDTLSSSTVRIAELELVLTETKALLESAVDKNEDLSENLQSEKDRNDAFEEQIEKIGDTVGTLDKLAKTDKELLQKYSKVYFLNEHYIPERLTEIEPHYLYREDDPTFLHAKVMPYLTNMLDEALEDGVKIWVVSAYRSFDEQEDLKGAYLVTYGSGANTFSADQGYSEHQLGTTLDFTTENLGGGLSGFEKTPAYTWLLENAHTYGFILSYPHDNEYYIFEPWHWRFVGEDLAEDLHEDEAYFYDLEQRKIDEYLISIFD